MADFTTEEIAGIVKAMEQEVPVQKELPLRPPGIYGKVSKVRLSELPEQESRERAPLTDAQREAFADLKVQVGVEFASKKMPLREVAALKEGDLITFDQLAEEPLDIVVQGKRVGRGELAAVDGHFAIKIVQFEE